MGDNPIHDLKKEASAAASLLASLKTTIGDDDELKRTVIEGETSLYEAAGKVLERLLTIKALQAGIKSVGDDLKTRAKRLETQEEALRLALLRALEDCQCPNLELAVATIYTSEGKDALGTFNEEDLPSKYFKRPDPVVDKALLLDDLKAGVEVKGAALKNKAPVLNIRYK